MDAARPIRDAQAPIVETFVREYSRYQSPAPPEMIEQVREARRERIRNKTRERLREERGEVLPVTIKRANSTPPAHVWCKMTPLRRYYDRVSRSTVSQVGYVGWVKKQLGWKLKDPNPWRAEDGKDEDQPRLDGLEKQIREENLRRRGRQIQKIKVKALSEGSEQAAESSS